MAAPQSKSSRVGTPAKKSVRFNDSLSLVRADIHLPAVTTSSGHSTKLREKRPCLSSGKVALQPPQRTSSPRLSDVGSDREADQSQELSKFLGSLGLLDPFQVSTPQKVGSLPYVPRLDSPDQAVRQVRDSATAVELPHSPLRASTPIPAPLPRTSVPSASRRRHHSCARERPLGEGSGSGEEFHSLPVLSIGTSTPSRQAVQSRLSGRPGGHRERLRSSGDVSLINYSF